MGKTSKKDLTKKELLEKNQRLEGQIQDLFEQKTRQANFIRDQRLQIHDMEEGCISRGKNILWLVNNWRIASVRVQSLKMGREDPYPEQRLNDEHG